MFYAIGTLGQPVRQFVQCNAEDLPSQLLENEIALEVSDITPNGVLTETGVHYAPSTLDDAKAARWEQAKNYRYLRVNGGLDIPGLGRVDTDATALRNSREFLSGVALEAFMAQVSGEPYSLKLTMSDNTEQTLTASQVIAIAKAVAAHVKACQEASSVIRNQINAAETEEAVAAVDIQAGYPV